jgi:putative membrane protein
MLLSSDEKQRIEAAIGALERRTAAEVVVAVVPHSGRPWLARATAAFGLGLAGAAAYLEWFRVPEPLWALVVEVGVVLASFALLGWQPLERLLVTPRVAARDVMERAFAIFTQRGLSRTKGHTGVLILLSELERRVVILGDEAIHARVGEQGWQAYIDRIVDAIKRGQAARGVEEVLRDLTPLLAEIAPPSDANDNELPDRVLDEP